MAALAYKRLVIKIGSALLVEPTDLRLRTDWLDALATEIAALTQNGTDVLIVSSGAIALGRKRLGLRETSLTLPQKQACAAAGQSLLTQGYERALGAVGLNAAQALLTYEDTENRQRWLNARATLRTLMELGVVPVVNENDTVATDEIRYGDNDRLAARTAQMIGADGCILMSDIDGLYTADPRSDETATHIPQVQTLTPEILAMGAGANKTAAVGTGGMATKLIAAQIATQAGCEMLICDGRAVGALTSLRKGGRHTRFIAQQNPRRARAQWIAGSLKTSGVLEIDAGALVALENGRSLLAAGVSGVSGKFAHGDMVVIRSAEGRDIARGLVAYPANEARKILGQKSSEIEGIIGYTNGAALVHRDNLVML